MGKNDQDKLYFKVFNKSLCNGCRKLLYNTKTDLSDEGRKEGKICKNVLYNFHCSFKGNNKNFHFVSHKVPMQ